MAGAVAVARRHGFSGTEAQRGARDRDGVRGAADAAGAAGGRDLRQLSRGQPGAVAADGVAAVREDIGGDFAGAGGVVRGRRPARRHGPGAGAGRGSDGAVARGVGGRLADGTGKEGAAGGGIEFWLARRRNDTESFLSLPVRSELVEGLSFLCTVAGKNGPSTSSGRTEERESLRVFVRNFSEEFDMDEDEALEIGRAHV